MADVIITPLLPGTSVQGNYAQGITGFASPQVPSILASLPPGALIQGFVLNRNENGQPVLRTDTGDFVLSTDLFLKIGSDVVVRVEATGKNFRANIVSVDNVPIEQWKAQNQHAPQSDPDVFVHVTAPPDEENQPAQLRPQIVATVVSTPAKAAPVSIPAAPNSAAPNPAAPTTSAPPQAASPASAAAPEEPELPSPGTTLGVRIVNVQLPNADAAPTVLNPYARHALTSTAALPPPSAPVLVGTVTEIDTDGSPIVQTASGNVKLPAGMTLPVGSRISLELGNVLTPSLQPLSALPRLLQALSSDWDGLQQLVSFLQDSDDPEIQQYLAASLAMLPQAVAPTVPNLTAAAQSAGNGLLFFLVALKGGDVRTLLGDRGVKYLEDHGKGELLKQVNSEFGMMKDAHAAAQPGQWQPTFLPVLQDGAIRMLRLFVKKEREKEKDGSKRRPRPGDSTRFVVEMEISQLGALQMDGLVRQPQKGNPLQFDLMMRSKIPLSDDVQKDIGDIYYNTAAATGFRGVLSFEATQSFTVNPLQEILMGPPGEIIA